MTGAPDTAGASGTAAPARSGCRWLLALTAVLALLGCCSGGALLWIGPGRIRDLALDGARIGDLAWQDPSGTWTDITKQQTSRRRWAARDAFLQVEWGEVTEGLERAVLPLRRPPNPLEVPLRLLRIDPARQQVIVAHLPDFARADVAEIARANGMVAAINASYFSDEGPIGLLIEGGQQLHPQSAKWAAHLLIDRAGAIRIVNRKQAKTTGAIWAIQGFPAIMSGGTIFSYIKSGSSFNVLEVDRRSAACLTADGRLLLLATDSGLVNGLSFYELGTVMGGLGCRDAMGLDGGSSTGFYLKKGEDEEVIHTLKPVPVIIGVRGSG